MLAVSGRLWCGCQSSIVVLHPDSLLVEASFVVDGEGGRGVACMASEGSGVWVALTASTQVRLYHPATYECLAEVDVTAAVSRMLAGCDAIIRQHKSACLRVTSLTPGAELLWVGTSAGVLVTLPHHRLARPAPRRHDRSPPPRRHPGGAGAGGPPPERRMGGRRPAAGPRVGAARPCGEPWAGGPVAAAALACRGPRGLPARPHGPREVHHQRAAARGLRLGPARRRHGGPRPNPKGAASRLGEAVARERLAGGPGGRGARGGPCGGPRGTAGHQRRGRLRGVHGVTEPRRRRCRGEGRQHQPPAAVEGLSQALGRHRVGPWDTWPPVCRVGPWTCGGSCARGRHTEWAHATRGGGAPGTRGLSTGWVLGQEISMQVAGLRQVAFALSEPRAYSVGPRTRVY
ncbi:uncharacterized protein LOC144936281 [Lampetra fluviatilis]